MSSFLYKQALPLMKLQESSRPTSTDDASKSLSVGSRWGVGSKIWICTDNTIGAAKWSFIGKYEQVVLCVGGETIVSIPHGIGSYFVSFDIYMSQDTSGNPPYKKQEGIPIDLLDLDNAQINLEGFTTTAGFKYLIIGK